MIRSYRSSQVVWFFVTLNIFDILCNFLINSWLISIKQPQKKWKLHNFQLIFEFSNWRSENRLNTRKIINRSLLCSFNFQQSKAFEQSSKIIDTQSLLIRSILKYWKSLIKYWKIISNRSDPLILLIPRKIQVSSNVLFEFWSDFNFCYVVWLWAEKNDCKSISWMLLKFFIL